METTSKRKAQPEGWVNPLQKEERSGREISADSIVALRFPVLTGGVMLNWLQHLFTARALERELADAKTEISVVEAKNDALRVENEQLQAHVLKLEEELEKCRKQHSKDFNRPIPYRSGWVV